MSRPLLLAVAFTLAAGLIVADEPKDPPKTKADADLVIGSVADGSLAKKAPDLGVIVTKKGFDELVTAWAIEKPFAVDFGKQFVVVATTQGSGIELKTATKDGDLSVKVVGTADLKPGFRYALRRVDRAGVKTVNGKPLPKE